MDTRETDHYGRELERIYARAIVQAFSLAIGGINSWKLETLHVVTSRRWCHRLSPQLKKCHSQLHSQFMGFDPWNQILVEIHNHYLWIAIKAGMIQRM